MKLKANVVMSRATGGAESEMRIHVDDEISGCRVLDLHMTLEEFAKALTSSYGKADMDYYPKAPIGKKHEWKYEFIQFQWTLKGKKSEEDAALKPFEVDGWKGERSDLVNHHCKTARGQRVAFHRYVEAE